MAQNISCYFDENGDQSLLSNLKSEQIQEILDKISSHGEYIGYTVPQKIHFLESLLPFKGRITANNKEIITSLLGLFIDDEDGWVSSFSSLVFVKLFGDTDHPFSESISQLQFNLQQFLDEKLERVVRDPYFQPWEVPFISGEEEAGGSSHFSVRESFQPTFKTIQSSYKVLLPSTTSSTDLPTSISSTTPSSSSSSSVVVEGERRRPAPVLPSLPVPDIVSSSNKPPPPPKVEGKRRKKPGHLGLSQLQELTAPKVKVKEKRKRQKEEERKEEEEEEEEPDVKRRRGRRTLPQSSHPPLPLNDILARFPKIAPKHRSLLSIFADPVTRSMEMDRKEISIPVQAEKVLSPDKKLLPIKVTRIKLNFETGSWKEEIVYRQEK